MERVIWGIGYNASKFFSSRNCNDISFFVDNDFSQRGYYLGKIVYHPTEINNWKDKYVYVPSNYYNEIKLFLEGKGLKEYIDFESYSDKTIITKERAIKNYNESLNKINDICLDWKGKCVFFSGRSLVKKDYRNYIRCLSERIDKIKFVSTTFWEDEIAIKNELGIDIINAPLILEDYTKISNENLRYEIYGKGDTLLGECARQIAGIYEDDNIDAYMFQVKKIKEYFETFIDKVSPSSVIAYTSVSHSHVILGRICQDRKIPIIFTHPGIIPGTLSFDALGEMGESVPVIFSRKFSCLSVTDVELSDAKKVWTYLYESKLNRKVQPKDDCIACITERIDKKRPIIFFAGQNDVFSHMVPYTERTQKYHSPIFKTSLDAASYIAEICKKNNWNMIYKPHPMYTQIEKTKKLPSNVIVLEYGDINTIIDISNVMVTILSSSNYNSLIRYKPVVMLGYNQTRGKGCTYEAFEKSKIEDTIKEALEKGFTQKQQNAFLKHIAQCLKYYLYDDLQERPIRYGRPVPKNMDEFYELKNLLEG